MTLFRKSKPRDNLDGRLGAELRFIVALIRNSSSRRYTMKKLGQFRAIFHFIDELQQIYIVKFSDKSETLEDSTSVYSG